MHLKSKGPAVPDEYEAFILTSANFLGTGYFYSLCPAMRFDRYDDNLTVDHPVDQPVATGPELDFVAITLWSRPRHSFRARGANWSV